MLTEYIDAAMHKAKYELLEDNEGFFGKIPGFRGVWGNAPTLEGCRDELRGALEGWILIKLQYNQHNLPVIDRININPKRNKRAVA